MPDNQTLQDHNEDLMREVAVLREQFQQWVTDMTDFRNDRNKWVDIANVLARRLSEIDGVSVHQVIATAASEVLTRYEERKTRQETITTQRRLNPSDLQRIEVYPPGRYQGD